jgi:raffinose/stachyose/melibiose transport system substrate-binding protein
MSTRLNRFLAIALVGLLAGCAGQGAPTQVATASAPPSAEANASAEPITLTFWDLEEGGGATKTRELLSNEFEAAHPNITVNRVVKSFDDLNATVKFALQGRDAPDIAAVNQGFTVMGALVKGGLIEPLDQFAAQYGWNDRIPSGVLRLNSFLPDASRFGSGNLYGLSMTAEIVGIFYNKAKLKELGLDVPKTIDEFAAAARAAHEKEGVGIAFGTLEKNPAMHLYTTFQNAFIDADYMQDWVFISRPGLSFDVPGTRRAAELLQKLALEGVFTPDFLAVSRDDAVEHFANGSGVFLMGHGSWKVGQLADKMGDNVGFMLVPRETAGETRVATGSGGIAFSISSKSAHKGEAAALLDFLVSAHAGSLFASNGDLPAMAADQEPPPGVFGDAARAWEEVRSGNTVVPFEDWTTDTMLETIRNNAQELMAGRISPEELVGRIQVDYAAFAP